jgi:hypothetical protein
VQSLLQTIALIHSQWYSDDPHISTRAAHAHALWLTRTCNTTYTLLCRTAAATATTAAGDLVYVLSPHVSPDDTAALRQRVNWRAATVTAVTPTDVTATTSSLLATVQYEEPPTVDGAAVEPAVEPAVGPDVEVESGVVIGRLMPRQRVRQRRFVPGEEVLARKEEFESGGGGSPQWLAAVVQSVNGDGSYEVYTICICVLMRNVCSLT